MVACFRVQNNLFMLLGGVLGLIAALLTQGSLAVPGYIRMFFLLLPVMLGVVVGRIAAGFWANGKLRQLQAILCEQVRPEEFLNTFGPIVEKTPRETIAYMDGCVKLAYAYEALGQFDEAMACLAPLEPDKLKSHRLGGMAITCNQKMRLLLLQEKTDEAAVCLDSLRAIADTAMERAPALGRSTRECVRLYENWLSVLRGQPADEEYLAEEVRLAKNRIHRSEIQLVLAQAAVHRGDTAQARKLLADAQDAGNGLFAARRAGELLSDMQQMSRRPD
ncbi:MAG: hypothetical protein ACI4MM_03660 [Candidatus Ventricola sp.]